MKDKIKICKKHRVQMIVWDFDKLGLVYTCEWCEEERKEEYLAERR